MSAGRRRRVSVDAFRGATIVAMILVNNPGDWNHVYWPLLHATWHGWTPTDLIFPFFLFIVGVSIVLALGRRREAGDRRRLILKIVRRSGVLVALGLFLSGFPFGLFGSRTFERLLETWRFPGVLQRIAVCYLVAALLYVFLRPRALKLWAAALLLGYWLLLAWAPVPTADGQGWTAPDLDSPGDHLAGWLDRAVFGDHLWVSSKVYDPEGLLSTLPAIATTLLGVLAGLVLTGALPAGGKTTRPQASSPTERLARLFAYGSMWAVAGTVWGWFLPINKPLWTSSYALFTAGLGACALGLCVWAFDLDAAGARRRLARPLTIYGVNAITVFVGSGVLARTLYTLQVGPAGEEGSLQSWLHQQLFASWLPPRTASLAYALAWIAGWYVVLWWMDRRRLVVKV